MEAKKPTRDEILINLTTAIASKNFGANVNDCVQYAEDVTEAICKKLKIE